MRNPVAKRKVKWVDGLSCMAALQLPSSLPGDGHHAGHPAARALQGQAQAETPSRKQHAT